MSRKSNRNKRVSASITPEFKKQMTNFKYKHGTTYADMVRLALIQTYGFKEKD